ncbi:AraC family transcriptional regulator [Pseudomonas phytophila]|uniref:AraC family transcriptional regulator n=1 Tax=Pseudomonas phytophila TaxID=2867264 RepID=UPI0021D8F446|nr:AraC family transcriptional regulator [Pseudomonas phytophila]
MALPIQPDPSDLISELLSGMRLVGVQFRRIEVRDFPGVGFTNAVGRAQFHFVGRGPVWLRSPDNNLYRMDTGTAVLIPHGGPHAILSSERTPVSNVKPFAFDSFSGEQGSACQGPVIFSCCMELELGGMQPLVAAMPEVLLASTLSQGSPEICPMLDAMERESLMLKAGHLGILVRLAEVVAALVIRDWVADGCGGAAGWLGALQDPRLSKTLVMMHKHPGRSWTVASLASEAGQSRSVFAQSFLHATGVSPLRYLTDLRMRLALLSLSRERQPIETIASQLGYGSLAAFSRAFKRSVGVSPGTIRASTVALNPPEHPTNKTP